MSSAFESIQQGLREAIEFAEGKPVKAIVHEVSPLDVKAIREHVGMTQIEFASAFGIKSLGHCSGVRCWCFVAFLVV